jgi:hypothetical protein
VDKLNELFERMKNIPSSRGVGNWVVVNEKVADAINDVNKIHDRRKKIKKILKRMK